MKRTIVVDSFDLYCITTLCPIIVFADHRLDSCCPFCKQPGEVIGADIKTGKEDESG